MTQKHRIHAINQWKKIDPLVRSQHASKMAKARYAKESPEVRKANAIKAVMARWHPKKDIPPLSPTADLQEKKEGI